MQTRTLLSQLSAALLLAVVNGTVAIAACPDDCPVRGGGTTSVDCLAEYFAGAPAAAVGSQVVRCEDGAACDKDGAVNGACVFDVRVCLNQDDPALPTCSAKGVDTFQIRNAGSDVDLVGLQSKVQTLLSLSTSACSDTQSFTVPLGGSADRPLRGRKRIVSNARGAGGRDFDVVDFVCMPPPRPLGMRHFVLNPDTSPLLAAIGTLKLPVGSFDGYLDLQAGIPDKNGIAVIDVVGASDYISANVAQAGMTVCIKPIVPAMGAGLVGCKGLDVSYAASVDHVAGVVGENGFTEAQCTALQGTIGHGSVERGLCSDGTGQSNGQPCLVDGDCGVGFTCDQNPATPHTGDCNGPVNIGQGGKGDSGRGAVAFTPDLETGQGGLRVELTFVHPGKCRDDESIDCSADTDCPSNGKCEQVCGDGPPAQETVLPLVSGPLQVQIFNVDGKVGTNRKLDIKGENFSCPNWTAQDGPGKVIFAIPQLHAFSLSPGQAPQDLITAFVLSGR